MLFAFLLAAATAVSGAVVLPRAAGPTSPNALALRAEDSDLCLGTNKGLSEGGLVSVYAVLYLYLEYPCN